jgi:predicted N-formylglutamate amidohydrolase
MDDPWIEIAGARESALLLIADHASNRIPNGIALEIAPHLLDEHIAHDIGVEALGRALCARFDCPGILGNVSRLVIDFNREEEAEHLIPVASDGHAIPGNLISPEERAARLEQYWRPYHKRITTQIDGQGPALLLSLHSFTPQLKSRQSEVRPWEIGILYNRDDRAARKAMPLLEGFGVCVGDQQPYSGTLLNATMNCHGEARGIAYLGIEMRQDLIAEEAGVARWADVLTRVIEDCLSDREAA